MLHGTYSDVLQDDDRQTAAAHARDDVVLACFSGRGKDCYEVARLEGEEI